MHTAARAPPPYCPMQRCSPHLAGSCALRVNRSCLLCGVTLVHPTPYASGFIPMRQAARAFPISTFYAVPLQSAPVSDNPPGVSLNLLCATIPSPLASRFSPARAPPVPPQCTTCLTAHAASFHSCHTCTASRGSSTGTPSNAAAPPALQNTLQHLRGHARRRVIVRGARFRFLENATRARARLLRGWPGERSS